MLHVITLFTVPDHEDAFVRSLRMNGDWQTLARRVAPELSLQLAAVVRPPGTFAGAGVPRVPYTPGCPQSNSSQS
jgi:hypothetical protein